MKEKVYKNDHCTIKLIQGDCMPAMAEMEENQFDLAIVDPPYGLQFGEFNRTNKTTTGQRYKSNKYKNSDWDSEAPNEDYFLALKEVAKNQIVWGGNYFGFLWPCKGFIFWNKQNPVSNFSDGELAYTSFDKVAKQFDYPYYGNIEGNGSASKKHHPTQKPVALYKWILKNYGGHTQDKVDFPNKILDTHGGSMSIAIACHDMGFDLTLYEIDEDYYKAGVNRFEEHIKKPSLFTPQEMYPKQMNLMDDGE